MAELGSPKLLRRHYIPAVVQVNSILLLKAGTRCRDLSYPRQSKKKRHLITGIGATLPML